MTTLTPAYGRDYKSQKEVEEAFHSNKDFVMNDFLSPFDGKYCNKTDLQNTGVSAVKIRYQRLTKVHVIKF